MTPEGLFRSALVTTGMAVAAVDVPLARQAIDLHLSIGGDAVDLLTPYLWSSAVPAMSLAFDGADLDRECRLFAIDLIRRSRHTAQETTLAWLDEGLCVAEAHARGTATPEQYGSFVQKMCHDTYQKRQDRCDVATAVRAVLLSDTSSTVTGRVLQLVIRSETRFGLNAGSFPQGQRVYRESERRSEAMHYRANDLVIRRVAVALNQ